jgi:hypothetical protein
MTTLDRNNFAIFILTHNRPHEVFTYNVLRKCGFTGKIFIIIDNEDSKADEYRKVFGKEMVIQFDKAAIGETFDIADTRTDRRATVYARNASFQIAEDLGLDFFMQLDDDYNGFVYRYTKTYELKSVGIKSLDKVLDAMITFLDESNALTVAMAQGGDYIGGAESKAAKTPLLRKSMNSFIFRTKRPITFVGRMNDDVNTYTVNGMRGELFFTTTILSVLPAQTQKGSGGMTEAYLSAGTYMKSMYSVMMCPSSVTVKLMQTTHTRPHHRMNWNNTVPKIINERHRKPYADTTPVP